MRHLKWSQQWFHANLSQRDTFMLAKQVPDVVAMKQPIGFYKELEKGMPASHWVSELLDHYGLNRFNCPYMFCMVVMNADANWPSGGGRSINGGFNRGGALLHIPARALDLIPDVQTLLRHEIAQWQPNTRRGIHRPARDVCRRTNEQRRQHHLRPPGDTVSATLATLFDSSQELFVRDCR